MAKNISDDRAQRILDAAVDLIAHYGYDKTTVSDIAGEAAVSKGAIYLHFDSKDDLFETLLLREMLHYIDDWQRRIREEQTGGTLGSIYASSLQALDANPFMQALFKRDARLLGSYLRQPGNFFTAGQQAGLRADFIRQMQQAGAVTQAVAADDIAQLMDVFSMGLVHSDLNAGDVSRVILNMGAYMDRAFTPEDANPDAARDVILRSLDKSRAFIQQYLDDIDDAQTGDDTHD